jgi:hypothetical protein
VPTERPGFQPAVMIRPAYSVGLSRRRQKHRPGRDPLKVADIGRTETRQASKAFASYPAGLRFVASSAGRSAWASFTPSPVAQKCV